jgi:hypothetical protein
MVKKLILLALMASTLTTCRSAEINKIRGKLIYAAGGQILSLDFSNFEMKPKAIYKSSSGSIISRISKINNNAFIFDECTYLGKCSIKFFNIKTGQKRTLHPGRLPTYIPGHDKLIFYDQSKGDRWWLFSSSLKNLDKAEKISIASDDIILSNNFHRSVTVPVVSISANEVVLNGRDRQLWIYQIPMSKIIPTHNKDCEPIVWRSETQQLLCRDWKNNGLFLLDINKKTKEELHNLKKGRAFLYIPEYDVFIYRKLKFRFPFGEGHDIFVYFIKEKREKRIRSNLFIRSPIFISDVVF